MILRALIACCVALPICSMAQPRGAADEAGELNPRTEIELKLPPMPKASNLLQFTPSAASTNRFYIDAESIFVGTDGIVRYTLVVKGAGGAENISYEGLRCETREQKYYAFGRADGTWVNARTSEWRPVVYKEINRQHAVLYADYLCPDGSPIKSARDAVNRFKYGVPYGAPPRSGNLR